MGFQRLKLITLQFISPSFFEGLAIHLEGLDKVLGYTQNLYLPLYQMNMKRHWTYIKRDGRSSVKSVLCNHSFFTLLSK